MLPNQMVKDTFAAPSTSLIKLLAIAGFIGAIASLQLAATSPYPRKANNSEDTIHLPTNPESEAVLYILGILSASLVCGDRIFASQLTNLR